MNPPAPKPKATAARRYGWLLLLVAGSILAAFAYLHPYRDVGLDDIPAAVRSATAQLDKHFPRPVDKSLQYATRRIFSSPEGPLDVEIRATLTPMGDGLVARQDDWYDMKSQGLIYQERFVLMRNLFAVHTRTREVAPIMHDMLRRVGWYNDAARSFAVTREEGGTPESPNWLLEVRSERESDTDGKSFTHDTKTYQRIVACRHLGEIDAGLVGAAFTGRLPTVQCLIRTSDQPGERVSEYAYLPDHGVFLLLNYEQQGLESGKLDVKASYTAFKAVN